MGAISLFFISTVLLVPVTYLEKTFLYSKSKTNLDTYIMLRLLFFIIITQMLTKMKKVNWPSIISFIYLVVVILSGLFFIK